MDIELQIILCAGQDAPERAQLAVECALSSLAGGIAVTMYGVKGGARWFRLEDRDKAQDSPIQSLIQRYIEMGGHVEICPACWNESCGLADVDRGPVPYSEVGISTVALRMKTIQTVVF